MLTMPNRLSARMSRAFDGADRPERGTSRGCFYVTLPGLVGKGIFKRVIAVFRGASRDAGDLCYEIS